MIVSFTVKHSHFVEQVRFSLTALEGLRGDGGRERERKGEREKEREMEGGR